MFYILMLWLAEVQILTFCSTQLMQWLSQTAIFSSKHKEEESLIDCLIQSSQNLHFKCKYYIMVYLAHIPAVCVLLFALTLNQVYNPEWNGTEPEVIDAQYRRGAGHMARN